MAQKKPIFNNAGALQEFGASDSIDPAIIATGTRDGSKFLRDDGTWQVPSAAAVRYIQIIAVPSTAPISDGANIIGAVESPISGTVTSLRAKTTSGTATVTFNKNGVSMGSVAATSSGVSSAVSVAITALDDITFDVASAAGAGLVVQITIQE